MKKEKSFRVLVFYAIIIQFMVLLSQNSMIRSLSSTSIKDYNNRDATVQVILSYESMSEDSGIVFAYTGTGTIIANDKNSAYVLTVRHVCAPLSNLQVLSSGLRTVVEIQDKTGSYHDAQVELLSTVDDLCIIKYTNPNSELIVPAQISDRPAYLDENIYMYAAPSGFYVPSAITRFQGISSGDASINSQPSAIYTIPASGGSSGASIMNSEGKIVGVLHSTLADFHHISLASTHGSMISFLLEFESLSGVNVLD